MRTKGIAFLAMTLIIAGCGNGPSVAPATPVTQGTSSFSTQIATPPPGSLMSTDSSAVLIPSTDSSYVSYPATDSSSTTVSASPTPTPEPTAAPTTDPAYATPMPTVAPSYEPLPLGTLPPEFSSSPAPTFAPSPTPTSSQLPDGLSDQVVNQWTTGWALFGTKRAHVDLLVNYFPASFFAPPANVTIQIAWTNGGSVVDTMNYGPWQLSAPNSEEATFDAPVESDGEQIQLLPAD